MRALMLHGPGDLRLEELPEPHAGPGELVVRVVAALTCATDAKILRRGDHPMLPALPARFGHELCGEVVAVGEGVGEHRVGALVAVANSAPCGVCRPCRRDRENLCEDLVHLHGAYADLVRVPARIATRNTVAVPAGMAPERAALAEPVACAVHGAARCAAGPDDHVIVLGGGLQGLMITALLAGRGCRVTVLDPHPERRARALRAGAAEAGEAPRDADSLRRALAVAPDGRGADLVVEAVGTLDAWRAAIALARPGGDVLLHGGCARGTDIAIATERIHYQELAIRGSYHHTPAAYREALRLLAENRLPVDDLLGPPITLDEVPAALAEGGGKRPVRPAG